MYGGSFSFFSSSSCFFFRLRLRNLTNENWSRRCRGLWDCGVGSIPRRQLEKNHPSPSECEGRRNKQAVSRPKGGWATASLVPSAPKTLSTRQRSANGHVDVDVRFLLLAGAAEGRFPATWRARLTYLPYLGMLYAASRGDVVGKGVACFGL